jgi:hypothetical protein
MEVNSIFSTPLRQLILVASVSDGYRFDEKVLSPAHLVRDLRDSFAVRDELEINYSLQEA